MNFFCLFQTNRKKNPVQTRKKIQLIKLNIFQIIELQKSSADRLEEWVELVFKEAFSFHGRGKDI